MIIIKEVKKKSEDMMFFKWSAGKYVKMRSMANYFETAKSLLL